MQVTTYLYLFFLFSCELCSTRVANELGAGNSEGARIAAQVALLLAVTETSIETTTLFALRHSYGYTFSNEKQVIDYVTSMAPLVCLSLALDSLQGVLTGLYIRILIRNELLFSCSNS